MPPTVADTARQTEVTNVTGKKVDDDDFFDAVNIEELTTRDIEMIRTAGKNANHSKMVLFRSGIAS